MNHTTAPCGAQGAFLHHFNGTKWSVLPVPQPGDRGALGQVPGDFLLAASAAPGTRAVVRGNISFVGVRSCWMGIIRDHIHGNVTVRGNRWADSDANEIVTNVIYGNVTCRNNVPGPQVGDSHGKPNVVHGSTRGCPHLPL